MAKNDTKETLWFHGFLKILGWLSAIIGGLSIAFYIGIWKSGLDNRMEIMEINQRHNTELTNLKIEYDNKIIELRNELNIYRITSNIASNGK